MRIQFPRSAARSILSSHSSLPLSQFITTTNGRSRTIDTKFVFGVLKLPTDGLRDGVVREGGTVTAHMSQVAASASVSSTVGTTVPCRSNGFPPATSTAASCIFRLASTCRCSTYSRSTIPGNIDTSASKDARCADALHLILRMDLGQESRLNRQPLSLVFSIVIPSDILPAGISILCLYPTHPFSSTSFIPESNVI